ncbi:MAG: Por secretion system C-terminal sorting protein [Fibrobacteres bacterium]|nr:Por secretion system C-terminal sorting protein [Fibrobacterota bacterium]
MPLPSFKPFAAVACLVAALLLPAHSEYEHKVRAAGDLEKLASEIQSSQDRGGHTVNFDYYGSVGTFKVDAPSDKVESLTFKRNSPDSEAVIRVDNTFLDIKRMPVLVTLKGLAFQLMPKSVLIAGADGSKLNGSLLIDSCFIFADDLDNTFLSWWADNASSIEIRNSFIVIKGSKAATTRIALTAGNIRFTNDLINFSGAISGTGITKKFDFLSNTVNKTQIELGGKLDAGLLPTFEFNQNLFTHHGANDAFGGQNFFVLSYGSFNEARSYVQNNKVYKTWSGFDFPASARFKAGPNDLIDTLVGKRSTELWNWYTENLDSNKTGLLSGELKLEKYNVMPQDSVYSWNLAKGNLKVSFQPEAYPRMIKLDTPATKVVLPADSALRRIFPSAGYAHFGPFRVGRITLGAEAIHGSPVLLANDAALPAQYQAQPGTSQVNSNPSFFENAQPTARNFILANAGNTPAGVSVIPQVDGQLGTMDKLVFSKVDSAGYTVVRAPAAQNLPPNLRSLETSFRVTTTAVINSRVDLGSKENVSPYSSDKVFWFFRNPDTLIQATKALKGRDSLKYTASKFYSSAKGDLEAYLVEKLSVPAGGITIPVADGSIRVQSVGGFQLTIDSAQVLDSSAYGLLSVHGYSFAWPFKTAKDSISVSFKANPDQDLFVKVGTASPVPSGFLRDSTGNNIKGVIKEEDKGKTFFLGIEYNILKGNAYNGSYGNNVTLSGFESTTSGKLAYDSLSSGLRAGLVGVVKDFRYLGGREMKAISVSTITPKVAYGMQFPVKASQNSAMIEAYIHDGQAWLPVPLTGSISGGKFVLSNLPPSARAVAVVERLMSAETYVGGKPVVTGTTLTLTPQYIFTDSLHHITHYCLELMSVDPSGTVDTDTCKDSDKKPIGQETSVPLVPNWAYQYRIQYYMTDEKIDGRKFEILVGSTFNLKSAAQPPDIASKASKRWHLVGFPMEGLFSNILRKQPETVPDSIKDTTFVLRFHKDKPTDKVKVAFDTLAGWDTLTVKRGQGYLMASAHPFKTVVEDSDKALALQPDTLKLDTGWNFIANPFPINMLVTKIRCLPNRPLKFWRLDTAVTGSAKRKYLWTRETTLRPFFGYAFHAESGDRLVFDPLANPATDLAKTAAGTSGTELEARIDAPWGSSAMTLSTMPRQSSIPFLPLPFAGPQLLVGGGGGYMIKAIANEANIDEPVVILSPQAGIATFSLTRPFRTGMAMRLIDLESGTVYDEAGARALPVTEGRQSYRLLAGDPAFVEAGTRAFLASAPAEIGISQNYPNPFRGRTQVELRWPSWQGGSRTAILDVIDMQGRTATHIDLGEIRVGKQVLTLDGAAWTTGVYLYRLTVAAGNRRIHLQKRMLVSP